MPVPDITTWVGAVAALVMCLMLALVGIVIIRLLRTCFDRAGARSRKSSGGAAGPDPWEEAGRRVTSDPDEREKASPPGGEHPS